VIIVVGIVAAAVFLILLALFVMQRKGFLGGKVSADKGMNVPLKCLLRSLFVGVS
jgi:hypothetical protein